MVFNDPDTASIIEELQENTPPLDAKKRIIERALAKQQEISLKLIQERDKEHLNATHTVSRFEALKSSSHLLKHDHEPLLHRDHDCMAIKGGGGGERCSKKWITDAIYHDINIHFCLHSMFKFSAIIGLRKVNFSGFVL